MSRMHTKTRWSLLGLVAVAAMSLACGAFGSGDGILYAGPPSTVQVGEPITFTESKSNKEEDKSQARIVVTAVDVHATSSHPYERPQRGQFVVIDVVVEVIEGESDIWPRSFRLVGSDGTVWGDEAGPNGFATKLDDLTIRKGQRKTGAVVFDGDPAKLASGKIELVNWRGAPVGYWLFSASSLPSVAPSAPASASASSPSMVSSAASSRRPRS